MKQTFLILTCIILCVFNSFAQTSKPKTSAKQAAPKPDLTEKRLRAHVEYLASDKLKGEKNIIQKAGYVAGILANYRLQGGVLKKVEGKKITQSRSFLQEFLINQNGVNSENYNVVGILEGTDASLKSEAIIIATNYTNEKNNDFSGVATLLELARTFTKERTNKRTIIFVAFGANQSGATVYLNDPIFPLEKTVAMFELDNIGNLRENKLNVGGTQTADEWKEILRLNNEAPFSFGENKPSTMKIVSKETGKVFSEKLYPEFVLHLNKKISDQNESSSFYAKKIPVLNFSTETPETSRQTSAPMNELNYEGLKRITDFVAEIVKAVNANEKRPTFTGKN